MFRLQPIKHYPVRSRGSLFPDVDRLFDDFFSNTFFDVPKAEATMNVDIKEDEKNYIVEAELPGVDKKDIHIKTKDDYLTISVEQEENKEEENANYIRRERCSRSLKRSFYMGNVDDSKIAAKYENGILTLTLPKKEVIVDEGKDIEVQ
jgi:HSP20 family protein